MNLTTNERGDKASLSLCEEWMHLATQFNPVLKEILGMNVQMRIIDQQGIIQKVMDFESGIPVTFSIGSKVPANSGPLLAIARGTSNKRVVEKSHYGIELRTINIPFSDRSGCISLTYNVDLQFSIASSLENIAFSTNQITLSSQEINQKAAGISQQFIEVNEQMEKAFQQSDVMQEVLKVIKEITDKLRLISINALIEAAHAGEHGRGFTIVAREVGKLSESTSTEMRGIYNSIHTLLESLTQAKRGLASIGIEIDKQSSSSKGIYESIHSISTSINELKTSTDRLLGLS